MEKMLNDCVNSPLFGLIVAAVTGAIWYVAGMLTVIAAWRY